MREIPSPPSWFEIDQYASAVGFGFREWATQIGNRFYLDSLLDAGKPEEFDQLFTRIKANPFDDLGFSGSFPSDKTVYPLTIGVAKTLANVLVDANSVDKISCDEMLRNLHPDIYAGQAHLFVNLRAPKTLLIKQFSDWLDDSLLERKRGPAITDSVTQTLAINHPVLPYQDLWLWYRQQKEKMPSDFVMTDWLALDSGNRDAVRALRRKAEGVFTMDYYFDLLFAASDSESTEAPPPSA